MIHGGGRRLHLDYNMFLRKFETYLAYRWSNCLWHLSSVGENSLQMPSSEEIDQKIIFHSLEYDSLPECEIF